MATSQRWGQRRLVLLLAAALALFLLAGSAQAMNMKHCPRGWGNCDGRDGCETNLYTNIYNCGYCGHACYVSWGQYAIAYCSGGHCYQKCKYGYFPKHGRCVKKF